jgi:mannitol 2-dehydrogenase
MADMQKLSRATIAQGSLRHPRLTLPAIDFREIAPRIVHLSVGNFARSHLAIYTEKLSRLSGVTPWAISSVSFTDPGDSLNDALAEQDFHYTVVEQSREGVRANIIGSIVEGLRVRTQLAEVLQRIEHPATTVVSLTITESGYPVEKTSSGFRFLPTFLLKNDIASPRMPRSAAGVIVEGLRRRMQRGLPPFVVLSCDNIQGNGDAARTMVVGFARAAYGDDFARQIEEKVSFPNSMVDRITPRTTQEHIQRIEDEFGYTDIIPVPCEPFTQWVLEDKKTGDLPPWELVGAQLTNDVHAYEVVKLRMLNAGHSALGYIGHLAGYNFIHEIAQDSRFSSYLSALLKKEVVPYISAPHGVSLSQYHDSVIERFSNPAINDQALRICSDGSGKLPKFILPSVKAALEHGGDIHRLCLCIAAWGKFLSLATNATRPYNIEDPMAGLLAEKSALVLASNEISHLLDIKEIFGELGEVSRFKSGVAAAYKNLAQHEPQEVVQRYF